MMPSVQEKAEGLIPLASEKGRMLVVGLGEIQISKEHDMVLACLGLGSCIGIIAYDPFVKVGAMVHVVLPLGEDAPSEKAPAKYANHAIPHMLREMEKMGVIKNRLVVKIVGGAKIISSIPANSVLNIGIRNIEAVKNLLDGHRLIIKAEDIGGFLGRSVWLDISTGVTKVKTSQSEIVVI
jgi:chemotaxis protein CheD